MDDSASREIRRPTYFIDREPLACGIYGERHNDEWDLSAFQEEYVFFLDIDSMGLTGRTCRWSAKNRSRRAKCEVIS